MQPSVIRCHPCRGLMATQEVTAPGPRPIRPSYDLPATIKSIQTGWQATFQTSSVVSALFTVVESAFLFFFNSLSPERLDRESAGGQALLVFTYLALFFSTSAAFSALLLTDELGEIHLRASQRASKLYPIDQMAIYENTGQLLKRYGARTVWRPVMWHWLLMLFSGYLCLVGQILTYLWMVESKPIAIAMSCVAGFSLLPLVSLPPSS